MDANPDQLARLRAEPAWFIPLGAGVGVGAGAGAGTGFARYASQDVVVVSCWCAQAIR
ncbi:hypothetical protein [Mycobacterium sp. URHB0021]